MPSNDSGDQAIEDRRAKAWDLRVRGKTYREIGAALGVSGKTAHQDCHAVLDRLKTETDDKAEHHRALQLARLERLTAVLMPVAERADIADMKRRIDEGEDPKLVIASAANALEAIDRLDKIEKRRAALLGLDAPSKVSAEVSAVGLDELDELRKAAQANACSPSEQQRPPGENGSSS